MRVHRIVAQAFIPNPEDKPEIDHIDCNPSNNCVENLRWCTHKENQNNPLTIARIGKSLIGKTGILSRRVKPIICVERGDLYWGVWEAQRQTGVYGQNINAVCRGRVKTAGGYHWRYAMPEEIKEVMQNEDIHKSQDILLNMTLERLERTVRKSAR